MNYTKVCLHCGRQNHSLSYRCTCSGHKWIHQYRTIDISIDLKSDKESIADSFENYSFDHPLGMLQYNGLPFQRHSTYNNFPVGQTPLHKLNHLGEKHRCHIYLKNEGSNITGCFKDRESLMCYLHSEQTNIKKAVIYSSGNAAASAASFTQNAGYRLITFVAGDTYPEKIDFIRNHGSDVIIIGNDHTNFETGYRLYTQMADSFSDYGFDDWSVRNPYRVQGDKTIAIEIVKQLFFAEDSLSPDIVLVPTANGSCLAGIWKGFKELHETGIINKLPRLIAVGIKNANPVYKAVHQKQITKPVRCDLSNVDAEDAKVGSIILAEEGYDSIEAAKAVLESNGTAVELHATDIQQTLINFLDLEGSLALNKEILPEPAALTSLTAIEKLKEYGFIASEDVLVSISTGHGLKAKRMLSSLLTSRPDLQDRINHIIAKRKHKMPVNGGYTGKVKQVAAKKDAVRKAFFQLKSSTPDAQYV